MFVVLSKRRLAYFPHVGRSAGIAVADGRVFLAVERDNRAAYTQVVPHGVCEREPHDDGLQEDQNLEHHQSVFVPRVFRVREREQDSGRDGDNHKRHEVSPAF